MIAAVSSAWERVSRAERVTASCPSSSRPASDGGRNDERFRTDMALAPAFTVFAVGARRRWVLSPLAHSVPAIIASESVDRGLWSPATQYETSCEDVRGNAGKITRARLAGF